MASNVKNRAAKLQMEKDTRPRATAKYIRISPYKVRTVLDLIRGKSVAEAKAILTFCTKAGSEPVLKVLNSAVANAENNLSLSREQLVVAECYADQGPHLKRMQPVSKGRGHAILKRTSHITVVLDAING